MRLGRRWNKAAMQRSYVASSRLLTAHPGSDSDQPVGRTFSRTVPRPPSPHPELPVPANAGAGCRCTLVSQSHSPRTHLAAPKSSKTVSLAANPHVIPSRSLVASPFRWPGRFLLLGSCACHIQIPTQGFELFAWQFMLDSSNHYPEERLEARNIRQSPSESTSVHHSTAFLRT